MRDECSGWETEQWRLETLALHNARFIFGQAHRCNCVMKHPPPRKQPRWRRCVTMSCFGSGADEKVEGERGQGTDSRQKGWMRWARGACPDWVLIYPLSWGGWPGMWPVGQERMPVFDWVLPSPESGHTAGAQWMLIPWLHFKHGKRALVSLINCN